MDSHTANLQEPIGQSKPTSIPKNKYIAELIKILFKSDNSTDVIFVDTKKARMPRPNVIIYAYRGDCALITFLFYCYSDVVEHIFYCQYPTLITITAYCSAKAIF